MGRPLTVLLVEADGDNRAMYVEYLRSRGLSLITADTTDQGLTRAAVVDVVVTGMRVPGSMDGIDFVQHLRASEPTVGTPIIMLTACAFAADKQRALAAGCNRFLPLPCLPNRLEDEIRQVARRRRLPNTAIAKVHSPRRGKHRAS
jgi:CheY-like chemotaxis protein